MIPDLTPAEWAYLLGLIQAEHEAIGNDRAEDYGIDLVALQEKVALHRAASED